MKVKPYLKFAIVLFFAQTITCLACSPEFDEAYLVRADKNKMLVIPEGDFLGAIQNLSGKKVGYLIHDADKSLQDSTQTDVESLKNSLQELNLPLQDIQSAVSSYQKARVQLSDYIKDNYPQQDIWYGSYFRYGARGVNPKQFIFWSGLDGKIPKEFRLYIEGARAYYKADFKEAIRKWEELLRMPEQERKQKTVWANFMLGKVWLNGGPEKAIKYFVSTREAAQKGFKDPLNLAFDSFGWQALAEFELGQFSNSLNDYLTAQDGASLVKVCEKISQDKTAINRILRDETARRIMLSWAISQSAYSSFANDWQPAEDLKKFLDVFLDKLEKIKDLPVAEADKIAWLYYNKGDFVKARRWVNLTNLSTPLAKLIDERLTLRDGNIDGAIKKLIDVVPSFEKSQDKDLFYLDDVVLDSTSQIGVLKLSRKDYINAFETLLHGKYWEDIAYVAEKVLTTDELEQYLQIHKDDPLLKVKQKIRSGGYVELQKRAAQDPTWVEYYNDFIKDDQQDKTVGQALEYLLARRYARLGQWDRALQFMPRQGFIGRTKIVKDKDGVEDYTNFLETIDPYQKLVDLKNDLQVSIDEKNSSLARAKAYYDAGLIMRNYGMEVMGTELDPDGFVTAGQYPEREAMNQRFAIVDEEEIEEVKDSNYDWDKEEIKKLNQRRAEIEKHRDFFSGSEDEEKRAVSSLPTPNRRFHYRYKAADLMWNAAELLPNNDELKAKALCIGGSYLKYIAKNKAYKFYKALVKTCPNTQLGQAAIKLKWFPKIQENI